MQEIKKLLSIGEKINLQLPNNYNEHEYPSRIENIYEDGTFDVLMPLAKNKYIFIKNDTVLKVLVYKEGAILEFKAKLLSKFCEAVPQFRLVIVSEIVKIQRRNFYRLKTVQKIKVRKIINLQEMQFEECFEASLIDISGGGVAFSSAKELDIHDGVEVNLNLNSKIISIFSEIVRKDMDITTNIRKYIYGVIFDSITEAERNIITKYIFDEQRKLAKKGMI